MAHVFVSVPLTEYLKFNGYFYHYLTVLFIIQCNSFMNNVEKWPNVLFNTARFLKFTRPFLNIMDERVKVFQQWSTTPYFLSVFWRTFLTIVSWRDNAVGNMYTHCFMIKRYLSGSYTSKIKFQQLLCVLLLAQYFHFKAGVCKKGGETFINERLKYFLKPWGVSSKRKRANLEIYEGIFFIFSCFYFFCVWDGGLYFET